MSVERSTHRSGLTRGALVLVALSAAAVVACVTWMSPSAPKPYHRTAPVPGAKLTGADECLTCHEDVQEHGPAPKYHADCEACHGPGSIHADSQEAKDIRFPTVEDCLKCHESGRGTHLAFATGEHARAGLICSDCHNPHNREPHNVRVSRQAAYASFDPNSQLCVNCHADVASRFNLPSHHPVREGMLSCTDCHSPHEDRRVTLGDRTALCAKCHQDKEGPWIYEHPPVAEDCVSCHDPHGSASYNLLATAQPALCLSCHTPPDDPHFLDSGLSGLVPISSDHPSGSSRISQVGGAAFYTRCTDCHGAIHGSYTDHHLRR